MKKNPEMKPKAVAEEYLGIIKADRLKRKLYVNLAQRVDDRLRKRRKRKGDVGKSKTGPGKKR
jgi:hypothetical protein